VFTLADTPKNLDFVRGLALTIRATSWILRERTPMGSQLDSDLVMLDARRFANRRSVFTRKGWRPEVGREPVSAA
jgi:hypothetical protein